MAEERKTVTEEIKVTGDQLVKKVENLIHEGNVRRIIVKDDKGKTVFEIPLSVGVVGAILAPLAAALGALAAIAAKYTIVVVREEEPGKSGKKK